MSDYAFRVDPAGLDELVGRMAAFESTAVSVTGAVDAHVARLHGEWFGPAAAEHLEAHRRWREGADTMHQAAASLRRAVTTAHSNYGAAVDANSRMWG